MLYSYGFIGKDTNSKDTFTLTKRLRYLSEGVAIGSKGFIDKIYSMFGGRLIKKKERKAHKTGISNMYSIRRLRE